MQRSVWQTYYLIWEITEKLILFFAGFGRDIERPESDCGDETGGPKTD